MKRRLIMFDWDLDPAVWSERLKAQLIAFARGLGYEVVASPTRPVSTLALRPEDRDAVDAAEESVVERSMEGE